MANLGNLTGGTVFQLDNVSLNVKSKDGIGGLIQEWLGLWAKKQGFKLSEHQAITSSQEFPDFYVDGDGMLEVKSFDINAGANFDVANFDSYCRSLAEKPERVNADYLIFGYELTGHNLTIKNIWLKKIWQITCASESYPLKVQRKQGVIYNIRPAAWYSNSARYRTFSTKTQFVSALYETQRIYSGNESFKKQYFRNKN